MERLREGESFETGKMLECFYEFSIRTIDDATSGGVGKEASLVIAKQVSDRYKRIRKTESQT